MELIQIKPLAYTCMHIVDVVVIGGGRGGANYGRIRSISTVIRSSLCRYVTRTSPVAITRQPDTFPLNVSLSLPRRAARPRRPRTACRVPLAFRARVRSSPSRTAFFALLTS